MDKQDINHVVEVLDMIEIALDGLGLSFQDFIPVILTDNGHEFCSPHRMEDFFIALGLEVIPPKEINLTPSLLKKSK